MATYQITSQIVSTNTKDSNISGTIFKPSFNANIIQKIDLTFGSFSLGGANNNDGSYKYDATIYYYNDPINPLLTYTSIVISNDTKIITITNTTSLMRSGSYNKFTNSFDPAPTSSSYGVNENASVRATFAPNFPIIIYY